MTQSESETCPACGSEHASRIETNPTPTERSRFSHPDMPKGLVPVGSFDVQCWECGERNTIVDYAPPTSDSTGADFAQNAGFKPVS